MGADSVCTYEGLCLIPRGDNTVYKEIVAPVLFSPASSVGELKTKQSCLGDLRQGEILYVCKDKNNT